jgi:hypothetical protein
VPISPNASHENREARQSTARRGAPDPAAENRSRRTSASSVVSGRASGSVLEVPARAGSHRFWLLRALHTHAKAPSRVAIYSGKREGRSNAPKGPGPWSSSHMKQFMTRVQQCLPAARTPAELAVSLRVFKTLLYSTRRAPVSTALVQLGAAAAAPRAQRALRDLAARAAPAGAEQREQRLEDLPGPRSEWTTGIRSVPNGWHRTQTVQSLWRNSASWPSRPRSNLVATRWST